MAINTKYQKDVLLHMHYRFVNIFMYRLQFMCQERSIMTGSLQKKHGAIYVVLNIVIDGERKQKWIRTELNRILEVTGKSLCSY